MRFRMAVHHPPSTYTQQAKYEFFPHFYMNVKFGPPDCKARSYSGGFWEKTKN